MQYSIVNTKNLDKIVFRLDAEYYHPFLIELEKKINTISNITLRKAKAKLDCSAFYPSIVPFYNFEKKGIPFLRVNEIQNGLVNVNDETAFLPDSILKENRSTIARCYPNDIIIAKGGNSLAKVALLTNEYAEYAICRDLIVLKTNNLVSLNPHFLWIFLHSNIGQQILLRTASQTGQPHLTVEAIYALPVSLLSDDFQDVFEKLYHRAQYLQKVSIGNYLKAEQILLSELGLSDWKPKHQLSFVKNFYDTQKSERIDAEYFQPKYDEIKKIISLKGFESLETHFNSIRNNGLDYYDDGLIGVIKTKQLSSKFIDFNVEDRTKLELKNPLIEDRDVLFASMGVGSLGKANILYNFEMYNKKFTIDSTLKIFRQRKNSKISPEVLAVFLQSVPCQELIYQNVVGSSGIISIYEDYLRQLPIPIVTIEVERQIIKKVQESHLLNQQSKLLLEIARKGVEMAIEQNEKNAQNWIDSELTKLDVKLQEKSNYEKRR